MEKSRSILIIVVVVLFGVVLNGILISRSIQRFKKEDRSISVKGFAEREVKSDFAVWTIRCRIVNNDLMQGSAEIETVKNKLVSFLLSNGIKQEDIIKKDLIVSDKMAQEYVNNTQNIAYRYLIDAVVQVRSSDVDAVQKVSRMSDELLKAGVVVSNQNQYQGAIQFFFTKLNNIKPEMLVEATRNAKEAANQFALESESELGKLKRATQGLFTIVDRDASLSGGEGYYTNTSDLYKKIRVVVNVEYSIE